jgi:hypothetical protein
MTLELIDFRDGLCLSTSPRFPDFNWSITLQRQVRVWIDAGFLTEDLTDSPSVFGLLRLTDEGRDECGLPRPVIKPVVVQIVEKQGELF